MISIDQYYNSIYYPRHYYGKIEIFPPHDSIAFNACIKFVMTDLGRIPNVINFDDCNDFLFICWFFHWFISVGYLFNILFSSGQTESMPTKASFSWLLGKGLLS